ncbi:hypothetical protein [Actinomadura bangladeshensis]|uniref:Uncharacterized protein n=1 Tax=Actinomadura bangladeshensis TaxID=453573 RepID=A0A4R4NPP1_9ACTN|nr:hypothetical protein [Actinomadura bangladeshensis]TDC09883.1 hypothetical protein E1284_28855 [Actinomadura bangladeshensis]
MEPLVAALARSLVTAMLTDVWHQILYALTEALRDAGSQDADELPDDLREARAILIETRKERGPDAAERSAAFLGSRLSARMAEHPDLARVLARFRDEELAPLLRSEQAHPRITVYQQSRFGTFTSGGVVTGDVVQSIDRDQVRDA